MMKTKTITSSIFLLVLAACSKPPEETPIHILPVPTPPPPAELTKEEKIELGSKIFKSHCMSCHGDPKVGAVGPPNADSSLELLRLKVLEGKYPEGYKPKRSTRNMPRFPGMKDKIEYLYEFLNKDKK